MRRSMAINRLFLNKKGHMKEVILFAEENKILRPTLGKCRAAGAQLVYNSITPRTKLRCCLIPFSTNG